MDDAATHIGPLTQAIMKFGRCVLECGVGWYSTPLIYAICTQHQAVSLETHSQWVNALRPVCGDSLVQVRNMVDGAREWKDKRPWRVVFIDCWEGSERVEIAKLFLETTCCIVGHDTERPYWDELLAGVRYKKHFELLTPKTTWFSNSLDVNNTTAA